LQLTPRTALLLTVGGFLLSAALLRLGALSRPPLAIERVRGGTRALFADRRVRGLLALCWLPPAFLVLSEGLAAPYAAEIGSGPAGVGLLLAAMPVGAVAAELAAGGLLRPAARERLVLPLAGCLLSPFLLFALRPSLLLALAHSSSPVPGRRTPSAWTARGITRAARPEGNFDAVPEELRARAMTVMSAGLMTVQGLGMAVGGLAAEFVPPHWAVVGARVTGTGCVLAAVRAVRRSPARPNGETTMAGM